MQTTTTKNTVPLQILQKLQTENQARHFSFGFFPLFQAANKGFVGFENFLAARKIHLHESH